MVQAQYLDPRFLSSLPIKGNFAVASYGNTIQQKPLISSQIHVSYIFMLGVWAAISCEISLLGEPIVNDVEMDNIQNASRFGAAFAYRLNNYNSLNISYTSGLTTRYGADFNTVFIAYHFFWFDAK